MTASTIINENLIHSSTTESKRENGRERERERTRERMRENDRKDVFVVNKKIEYK